MLQIVVAHYIRQRNLLSYRKGDDTSKLKYKLGEIHIGIGSDWIVLREDLQKL